MDGAVGVGGSVFDEVFELFPFEQLDSVLFEVDFLILLDPVRFTDLERPEG
jgi:hypothetical protein